MEKLKEIETWLSDLIETSETCLMNYQKPSEEYNKLMVQSKFKLKELRAKQ